MAQMGPDTHHRYRAVGRASEREKVSVGDTEWRGSVKEGRERSGVASRAPPGGTMPHPATAPVKAVLFTGNRKIKNSV